MKYPTLLALCSVPTVMVAQDLLDPLIVTASRSGKAQSQTAYSASVIDAQTLRDNTIRTLPEALSLTPGVLVQKTAYGHGSPVIRGFIGRQNLLMVDGVRMNNSTMRSGPVQYWNTVDAFSLDHMELIRNQGSVLYGSDSVGGTLNVFTKSSDFRARQANQTYTNGSAFYELRSNGRGSHQGRVEFEAGVGEKFGVWLGLSAKEFGDIRDSAVGLMDGTGYPERALDFRFDAAVSPDSTVTVAHQSMNQDSISRWHRTLENKGWKHGSHVAAPGTWNANTYDQERSMTYVRYAGSNAQKDAFIHQWTSTLSYQTSQDSEYQNRLPANSSSIRRSNIDLETIGVDLTLETKALGGNFVYGFDYYHDDVNSSGSRNNLAGTAYRESLPIADDSKYDLLGLFTQYAYKPVDRFELTTGVRYTAAHATLGRYVDSANVTQTDESRDWDAWVGSLRGVYTVNPEWSVFGGISQAFRAPNLDDLSGNLTSRTNTSTVANIDVNPERFLTYELGVRRGNEKWSGSAAVFYTDIDDLISLVPIAQGSSSAIGSNSTKGYIYGVELEGAWRLHPQWTWSGFAAWQDGRNQVPAYIGAPAEDKPMSRQMPLTASTALRWTDASARFWVEGRITGAVREDRITPEDQAADNQRMLTHGNPGYIVASVHSGWRVNERLNLAYGVENVTNEVYRNAGSGQNEPGLNHVLSAKMTW